MNKCLDFWSTTTWAFSVTLFNRVLNNSSWPDTCKTLTTVRGAPASWFIACVLFWTKLKPLVSFTLKSNFVWKPYTCVNTAQCMFRGWTLYVSGILMKPEGCMICAEKSKFLRLFGRLHVNPFSYTNNLFPCKHTTILSGRQLIVKCWNYIFGWAQQQKLL